MRARKASSQDKGRKRETQNQSNKVPCCKIFDCLLGRSCLKLHGYKVKYVEMLEANI